MGRFVVEPVDGSENRTCGKTGAEYSGFKPLKFAPRSRRTRNRPTMQSQGNGRQLPSTASVVYCAASSPDR